MVSEEDGPSEEDMSHDSEEYHMLIVRIASTRSCQRQEPQEKEKISPTGGRKTKENGTET